LTWHAKISVGVPLGLLFLGLTAVLDAWLLHWLLDQSIPSQRIDLLSFLMGLVVLVSLPLLLFLAYQSLSCLTLRYRLDRNGLYVRWMGSEQIVPIRDIQRVLRGREFGGSIEQRRGVRWPGHERGEGMVPGVGRTQFLATRPLAEQLLLVTTGGAYGISPSDLEGFLQAFEARRELGPNRLLGNEVQHSRWFAWPLWNDQTAGALLGTAIVINLGLFGYLSARFPGLDLQLPLHFDNQGLADRIGTRVELFALPIIGLIILVANLILGLILYQRERAGSYLLWGGAAVVQALFWLAVFSIGP
jgi:hypothetical protein